MNIAIMKSILNLIGLFFSLNSFAQNLDTLYAKSIFDYDFSVQAQENWKRNEKLFFDVYSGKISKDDLSEEDQLMIDTYDELKESFWDIGTSGCSWYCGAGGYTVSVSSELKFNKNLNYIPENLMDFNYKTAWAEGVKGQGIGETIEFSFPPAHPRMTKILMVNGYVKNKSLWNANSRVKELKMLVNGKPYTIIHLNNDYAEQEISLNTPLGNPERKEDQDISTLKNRWTISFEILSVYPGDKYDDTVISEIYFDGIDVHCLSKGTQITMANGELKSIENLKIGDQILSYNLSSNQLKSDVVKSLASPIHHHLVTLTFSDGTQIKCTPDHPFLTKDLKWTAVDFKKTQKDYLYDKVKPLQVGLSIKTQYGFKSIQEITKHKETQQTYTIVELEKNTIFIANGVFTGTEPLRIEVTQN